MPRWQGLRIGVAALCCTALATGAGAAPSHTEAHSLAEYETFCYCEADGLLPQSIVRMDNNGEILLACRAGETRRQLRRARIDHTESQLQLLKDWRLLAEEGGILRTRMAVLPPPETLALRKRMRRHAKAMAGRIEAPVRAIGKQLRQSGRERNTYAVLFAYVLDGQVWERFRARGKLTAPRIGRAQPFWSGTLWAAHPPRAFTCGTNSISRANKRLLVSWSRSSDTLMKPFLADWNSVVAMFEELIDKDRLTKPTLRRLFASYDIFDSQGRYTGARLREAAGDPLYEQCQALAKQVADLALARLKTEQLMRNLDLRSEEEALVIAYHELMWELLDLLEARGAIAQPAAFANPEQARPSDFGDLILLVEKPS